jgi:hypothetical protein
MAFLHRSNIPTLPFFYDVTQAVGARVYVINGEDFLPPTPRFYGTRKLPNRRDDVMLVQYLLQGIYAHPARFQPPLLRPSGPDMVVDGLCGP